MAIYPIKIKVLHQQEIRKELISKKISSELEEVIEERSTILAKSEDKIHINY